jgi:arsenite methyltransferase
MKKLAGMRGRVASVHVSATELEELLEQAGFLVQEVALVPQVLHHESADAALTFVQASSFGNALGHLPEPLRGQASDEIKRELEALRTNEGIRQEGTRIVAIAIKPRRPART